MRTAKFEPHTLAKLLHEKKIATMEELKQALGTKVPMTVFRKLRQLGYCSSYSHGGAYYTLQEIPRYDERGLWRCGPARLLPAWVPAGHLPGLGPAGRGRLLRQRAEGPAGG